MIKIENLEVCGWEPAIRGMRNPMNSWEKSDSLFYTPDGDYRDINGNTGPCNVDIDMEIGYNDHKLMMRLAKAGTEHSKYRRMIVVYADITAPLYWWKEFDTYKVGTVANSCSTMHKIHAKEFTMDDFSCEHLLNWPEIDPNITNIEFSMSEEAFLADPTSIWDTPTISINDYSNDRLYFSPYGILNQVVDMLNRCRELYLETKDKRYWWQMIQLLPSSYNQKRTVMLNYENLAAMYRQRKDHKLDEWHEFCHTIEELPYSELITLKEN